MTTTNLFVELVVIGVGAGCWVCVFGLSIFGFAWIQADLLNTYPVLVALLTAVYLLGIIADRAADCVFEMFFSGPLRARYFGFKREYQDARRLVFNYSGRLADMHDYGRTRIRICRGWALNAVLMAISLNVMLYTQFSEATWCPAARTWGTLGCLMLAVASWWSWRTLCLTEYLKIRENAEFLRDVDVVGNVKNAA